MEKKGVRPMERSAHSPFKSPLDDRELLEVFWLRVVDVMTMIDHELAARSAAAAAKEESAKVDAPVI
jgi:hypothetical protein